MIDLPAVSGSSRLSLQRFLGRLAVMPIGVAVGYLIERRFGISLPDQERVRAEFSEIAKERAPLLICANHLTLVDSLILLWALAPLRRYVLDYRLFAWNVPAHENYCRKPLWRAITYLSKCVPIRRDGPPEHIDSILGTLAHLLSRGDYCMIFPEGTRSRTGRFDPDQVGYGVGRILAKVPGCRVLCIYHRGRTQESYSDFPNRGEQISMDLEVITPHTPHKGLRAIRDYSQQVAHKIAEMEARYFATHAAATSR